MKIALPSEFITEQNYQALSKGKKLADGTIREWSGKKYKKVNGKWLPHSEGSGGAEKKAPGSESSKKLTSSQVEAATERARNLKQGGSFQQGDFTITRTHALNWAVRNGRTEKTSIAGDITEVKEILQSSTAASKR